ncbi:PREDICTED: C-type lectin lectoxin-Lio2-like [Branchiostoma belcheri]|uniref:C-type lectin lectoxin-Lio2-like n=1 Tax=Branchiostoma belcheri TaxID=7741 RepID=A0A6P4ZEH1_BRABE|nr:PREDICTED: C-type lectin lectoxin-Lio2-like [Branchiostoma belcheri]
MIKATLQKSDPPFLTTFEFFDDNHTASLKWLDPFANISLNSKTLSVTVMSLPTTAAKSDDCRFGYKLISGACFRLDFREMSYGDASEACKGEGARLAMPKTKELDMALSRLVYKEGENKIYYIGLRGAFSLWARRWVWDDGSPLGKYKGWNPGEPASRNLWMKLCVQYWSGVTGFPMWDDYSCDVKRRFICQQAPLALSYQ